MIADDDRDFRDALGVLIELVPELAVAGKAGTAEEAIELVESTNSDACLLDLFMPGMSGVDAVRELRVRYPELVIVVMTGFDAEEMLQAALDAGAEAAMRKDRLLTEVGDRLRAIEFDPVGARHQ